MSSVAMKVVVGLVVSLALAGALFWRCSATDRSDPPKVSSTSSGKHDAAAALVARPNPPRLPAVAFDAGPSVADKYESQPLDQVWAAGAERTLRGILTGKAREASVAVECRTFTCRIALSGDEDELVELVELVNDELPAAARSVTLSRDGDSIYVFINYDK